MVNTNSGVFRPGIVTGYPTGSLSIRIGAEHLHAAAFLLKQGDGFGDFLVLHVPLAIDEEVIFPDLPLARAGFYLGHIDAIPAKRGKRMMQGSDLV